MYKVGICGHFGGKREFLDGQTVKTKSIYEELVEEYGKESIYIVDTFNWRQNPIRLLFNCINMFIRCKNIITLPAMNGVKIFIPFFCILNYIFRRNIIYIVVGGWLPEFTQENIWLKKWLNKFNAIFVETKIMKEKLKEIDNISIMPNFKRLKICTYKDIKKSNIEPIRLCTFSRVNKEKGIEDAIHVVESVNHKLNRIACTLDIYGPIDDSYRIDFENIISNTNNYISYRGKVAYNQSIDILKEYNLLLFPTYYYGEGFAGTILDGFSAGLPVIASDWKYNSEIVINKKNGFLYEARNNKQLEKIIFNILDGKYDIEIMRKYCLECASNYIPKIAIKKLVNTLR